MKNVTSRETLDALLDLHPLVRKLLIRPMELRYSHNLTMTQFHAMLALCFTDSLNMTQLATQLYVSKQQLTKIIDGLVEKGYVHRFGDENNRRVVLVEITDAGRQMMQSCQSAFIDSLLPVFEQLTDTQRRKLMDAASDIRQVLSDIDH